VAPFFVSRVDGEVDKRLEAIGTDEAAALKGKAAIANARLAYASYQRGFDTDRWRALAAEGANRQRPLWASTGVKDPSLPDTLYVAELVVADTVNTMPEKTMDAFADHGVVAGDAVAGTETAAQQVMDALAAQGIFFDDVVDTLEREGVDKFVKSWDELVETVQAALDGDDKEQARRDASRRSVATGRPDDRSIRSGPGRPPSRGWTEAGRAYHRHE
jgi:transaldolase